MKFSFAYYTSHIESCLGPAVDECEDDLTFHVNHIQMNACCGKECQPLYVKEYTKLDFKTNL